MEMLIAGLGFLLGVLTTLAILTSRSSDRHRFKARIVFMLQFKDDSDVAIHVMVDEFDAAGAKVGQKELQGSSLKLELSNQTEGCGTLEYVDTANEWVVRKAGISVGAGATITGTFSDPDVNPPIVDQAIEGEGNYQWTGGEAVSAHGSFTAIPFTG